MNTKHTPTPWHVQPIGSKRYIEAQGPKLICDMQRDDFLTEQEVYECDANAAFIVRACNSHEALVEALEGALFYLKDRAPVEYDKARSALALAKEGR